MSVKKLLCGAAIASLLSAPAMADVTVDLAGAATTLASETDFSDITDEVAFTPLIETASDLPAGQQYRLDVTLTGGAKLGTFTATDVQSSAGSHIESQVLSTKTDTEITMLFSTTVAGTAGATTDIELPIQIIPTSCSAASTISIELTDASTGLAIEGGTASLIADDTASPQVARNFFDCEDGLTATIKPTSAQVNDDADLSLDSSFTEFVIQTAASGSDVTSVVLGEIDLAYTAGTNVYLNDEVLTADADAFGETDTFDDTYIDDVTVDLMFEDAAGVTDVVVDGVAAAQDGADDNLWQVTLPGTAITSSASDGRIIVTVDGTTEIAQQTVTVAASDIGFTATSNVSDQTFVSSGLTPVTLEGNSFGPFDWVGDASKSGVNVFRGTGFDNTDVPAAVITLANASNGAMYNGTTEIDTAWLATKIGDGGELVLTPADIETASGSAGFGRADVTFTFFTSGTLDMDRLVTTQGVVSAFGDTNNEQ